jgi:hypothetical protein
VTTLAEGASNLTVKVANPSASLTTIFSTLKFGKMNPQFFEMVCQKSSSGSARRMTDGVYRPKSVFLTGQVEPIK